MKRIGVRMLSLGVAAALAAVAAVRLRPLRLELVARGEILWSASVARGEEFDVAFTHSAELCRWTHHYRAGERQIEQVSSTFECFGAGMPAGPRAAPDGGIQPVLRGPGGYTVPAPGVLPAIRMMNWDASDIVISLRGGSVLLAPLLSDFEQFRLRVQ
jgi:hypothetical protein